MGKQSLIAKKINFGYLSMREIVCSHMTTLLPVCLSTPQGNQCEMSHFLACVVTCNLTVHIHVEVNWQLSKLGNRSFALAFAKSKLDVHVRVIDIMA